MSRPISAADITIKRLATGSSRTRVVRGRPPRVGSCLAFDLSVASFRGRQAVCMFGEPVLKVRCAWAREPRGASVGGYERYRGRGDVEFRDKVDQRRGGDIEQVTRRRDDRHRGGDLTCATFGDLG
jgi:hypothetical protein